MIIYLDTNILIYAVEHHPIFGPRTRTRLANVQSAGDTLRISDLTCMECLVGPLRAGNTALEGQFRVFFAAAGLQVVSITPAVCERAALIRAKNRFKPMDALQLAAAVEHGADVFLTNDVRLSSFPNLTVELLP
jgi:predicted nucleic acid-binding protein